MVRTGTGEGWAEWRSEAKTEPHPEPVPGQVSRGVERARLEGEAAYLPGKRATREPPGWQATEPGGRANGWTTASTPALAGRRRSKAEAENRQGWGAVRHEMDKGKGPP